MKNAIVTGGTKGIGKAIAMMLLQEGYFVYATYGNDDVAAESARLKFMNISDKFSIVKVNQADKDSVHSFADSLKDVCLHCLVCNAGSTLRKPVVEISDSEWETVMRIGVNSHFYLIRDLMSNIQADSRIIFIGSMMAVHPHATSLAYGTMKSAVHGLAMNLVKEFEGTGTTVNVIAPGFVETEWQKEKPVAIRENICKKTAVHRFATPEEVADTAKFIISNGFVNGAVIEVSGGYCYK